MIKHKRKREREGEVRCLSCYNSSSSVKRSKSREDELKEAGWVKQFATCEPRLSEFLELYESLGFEVHLDPATLQDLGADAECNFCYAAELDKYKTIYIRPKAGKTDI